MARPKVRDDSVRSKILDAAVDLVRTEGRDRLTTRRLAHAADASLASIGELFGGREGVVRDVAGHGFRCLASLVVGVADSDDAAADLWATSLAFRTFATGERHLFEVMFSRPLADFEVGPEEWRAATDLRDDIVRRVARLLELDATDPHATDAALGLVALTRGLAAQELAGILGSTEANARRRWETAITTHLAGLTLWRDARSTT